MAKKNKSDRREFISRVGKAVLAGSVVAGGGIYFAKDRDKKSPGKLIEKVVSRDVRVKPLPGQTDLVVVKGKNIAPMLEKAVDNLGGINRFVSKGEKVILKPNISWNRTPAQAANTDPQMVAAMVDICHRAGAAEVTVLDNSCNQADLCYRNSGIAEAAKNAGAKVLMPDKNLFTEVFIGSPVDGKIPVLRPFLQADKIIALPKLKHHSASRLTITMKGWWGLLGQGRGRLHQDINGAIARLGMFIRPTLTVVDATTVLVRNGPQGGNLGDVMRLDKIIATTDQVAADAMGAKLMGVRQEDLPYLALAAKMGVGNNQLERLVIEEVEV